MSEPGSRFYIAGPMRGRSFFNFHAFDRARDLLVGAGYEVISPADLDREAGFDPFVMPSDSDWSVIPNGFDFHEAIRRDYEAILQCDSIYMLEGWEQSKGARAEHAMAEWLGLDIVYQVRHVDLTDESSEHKQFSTGARRSKDADGTRYDLVSPIGLRRVAETCREGADKYGDFNWEKGIPVSEMLNHGLRHIYLYLSGNRDEDHLAHAAWNLLGAMHSEELWPELNTQLRTAGCKPPKDANGQESAINEVAAVSG